MPRRSVDAADAAALARRIGRAFRERREGLGWTQAGAAERLGLSPEGYARIERGAALPSFPTFVRACGALQTTPDVLLAAPLPPGIAPIREPGVYPVDDLGDLLREIEGLDEEALRVVKHLVHLLWRARKA